MDRRAANGVVGQVKALFDETDALILGLAPEGTRKHMPNWKTGFIYIANAAQVPVVPMALDYSKKQFVIMPAIYVSDDIEQTLVQVQQQFSTAMGKYPQQVSGAVRKTRY